VSLSSWNVPAHAGLLCDKTAMLRDAIKAALFITANINYNEYSLFKAPTKCTSL
jgi:hypothetical protein